MKKTATIPPGPARAGSISASAGGTARPGDQVRLTEHEDGPVGGQVVDLICCGLESCSEPEQAGDTEAGAEVCERGGGGGRQWRARWHRTDPSGLRQLIRLTRHERGHGQDEKLNVLFALAPVLRIVGVVRGLGPEHLGAPGVELERAANLCVRQARAIISSPSCRESSMMQGSSSPSPYSTMASWGSMTRRPSSGLKPRVCAAQAGERALARCDLAHVRSVWRQPRGPPLRQALLVTGKARSPRRLLSTQDDNSPEDQGRLNQTRALPRQQQRSRTSSLACSGSARCGPRSACPWAGPGRRRARGKRPSRS